MASSTPPSASLSIKLLIDTKTNKVLFAECSKDFVDFIFKLLTLPLGTVITVLKAHTGMVGCLGTLYKSIEELSDEYIQPNQRKDYILHPNLEAGSSAHFPLLKYKPTTTPPPQRKIYGCRHQCSSRGGYVSENPGAVNPNCGHEMSLELKFVSDVNVAEEDSITEGGGGYVKEVVTYMVMDDLAVAPMSTISGISMLNKFAVKDVGALEERVVQLAMAERVKLLRASLGSKTVLTDVFLTNASATENISEAIMDLGGGLT